MSKNINKSFKFYPDLSFTAVFIVMIIYLLGSCDAHEKKSKIKLSTFNGAIKSVSHNKPYRKRNYTRLMLENYDFDFLLYHVPNRKEAIYGLKKGQLAYLKASDDEMILDRDGIKTYIIYHIETEQGVVKTLEDELEFKGELLERFLE